MTKAFYHIGIDTSNYTTSAAAVSAAGEIFSAKRILEVPQNSLGLRQSDALFCHTRALPTLFAELRAKIEKETPEFEVLSFGATSQPRRREGSYMPCFLAGVNAASAAAHFSQKPLFLFSHQEGHIESARCGAALCGKAFPEEAAEFFALHLSGGTGEILAVKKSPEGYDCKILASALDITAGQLIDRGGVALGLAFPAGAELEKLALQSKRRFAVKIAKKETGVSFSGFENKFRQMIDKGEPKEDVARYIFSAVLAGIEALLSFLPPEKQALPVLFSGGVSSSVLLREALKKENRFFAPPGFSADNAIGTALLAKRRWEEGL